MILNYYNDLDFQPSELFLSKDFGEVATVLGHLHGHQVAHLVCCNKANGSLLSYAGSTVTQAEKCLPFLPRRFDALKNFAVYRFLWTMRRKFSVLTMFPFAPSSDLVVARLFKMLNPGARIVIKLDANLAHLESLQKSYLEAPRNPLRQHASYQRLLRLADLVIYETRAVGKLLSTPSFLGLGSPAKYLNVYNGVSVRSIAATGARDPATTPRENIIIFSGRLSAPEKNIELIFRANPVPPGWKIRFLGRIDDAFLQAVEPYRQSDPEFDLKYEFAGQIDDKKTYYDELSRGKVLLLCSVKEGFPMVYAEAHFFGLRIVTTNVSGSEEATDSGRFGSVVKSNDLTALRSALHSVCEGIEMLREDAAARAYGRAYFVWEDSLQADSLARLFASVQKPANP